MLDPSDRSLLLESLRPPDGYRLDRAIGTSYSLDLLALLTTPLAFTFFDWEDEDGAVTADPLKLLQAVRSNAGRIMLFCQAGEIKVPPADQRLTAHIEASVVEVRAPKGGVFHPKVWLLRFTSDGVPVRYRFLCASRNLTFDRCWDSLVVLDGQLLNRKNAFAINHPLGDFIAALPGLAKQPLPQNIGSSVRVMAEEVRKVQWEPPEGITDFAFYPMGLEARTPRPLGADVERRPLLVLSPFVRDAQLQRLVSRSPRAVLISRPDELAKLSSATLALFKSVYAFDPDVEEAGEAEDSGDEPALSGLHAKMYLVDDGWNARLLFGSANATNAAFSKNVEFLVELVGSKKDFGIDRLLSPAEGGQVSFLSLLQPWTAGGNAPNADTVAREQLEERVEVLKHAVAGTHFHADISALRAGGYAVAIRSQTAIPDLGEARLRCWPVTLRPERATQVQGDQPLQAHFEPLTLDALTGFLAFELTLSAGAITVTRRFVCSLSVEGMPADRLDRLLASILTDKDNLMRLIWLLLEAQGLHPEVTVEGAMRWSINWKTAPLVGYPLFERLLAAIATEPERIGEIGRLIGDLMRTPEGAQVVPQSLLQLWDAVKQLWPEASTADLHRERTRLPQDVQCRAHSREAASIPA